MKLRRPTIRSLAALAASLSLMVPVVVHAEDDQLKGDPEAARSKISMCMGCHSIKGYKANFPSVYHVPKIAGQNAEYLLAALKEYANGARTFPTMRAIAESLSEQDMADLAAYYSTLK